jgi:23S rRNA pseudouridine2605 synthase
MRINAYLARAGIASRRGADDLVKKGRVSVNGQPAQLNTEVAEKDRVEVDGRAVRAQRLIYILLHKPVGYITTLKDPESRPKVTDLIDLKERLVPVGRLDFNTSGALLLSNDGPLAHKLMHPSSAFNKTYEIRVEGRVTDEILNKLSKGIELEDGLTAPAEATRINGGTIKLVIHEGRNRQVRRMIDAVGLKVKKLHRSAYGPLDLEGLPVGDWRELSQSEISKLNVTINR